MMMKTKHHLQNKKINRHKTQGGNIFFLLFSSIIIVGAFAVGTSNVLKGIVTSMSDTTRKTLAEEKMMAGARLAIQESTKTGPTFGQCDTDSVYNFVEPLPTRDPGSLPAPIGGGWLPTDIGASTKDPWGTEYGYCAWNLGDGTCVDSTRRLQGGTATSDLVVAVISAGRDRKFSTTCNAYPTATPVSRAAGSDDIVLTYTYDDATGLGGEDLWKVTDTAPDTASIDKNIDVTGSAAFTGALNLMQKGLILPADPGDDSVTGACNASTDQQLRINTSTSPLSLEICDFTGGSGWTAISFGGSAPPSSGLPTGTVAWFKFDEGPGSTSTTDTISSYAGTMTGFNTTTDWVGGKNGYALRFDGSSTKIDFGSPAALNNLTAYTMCAWIDPDTTGMSGTLPTIISKANSGGDRGQENFLYMSQTPMYRIGASSRSAPYSEYTNSIWPTNNWIHVCGSWDGGTTQAGVKLYVNGVRLTQTASGGASGNTPVNDSTFNWIIGDNLGAAGNYHFKGLMDDVVIYDRALTDNEVQTLYTAVGGAAEASDPFIPPSGLIGWWKFDELGGTVAKDSSVNNSIGSLKGPVAFVPGRIGNAAYFNGAAGSNSYVNVGNPAVVNDISPVTVCAWIKPDPSLNYPSGIFDKGNAGGGPNTIGITMYYEDTGGVTFLADKSERVKATGVSPGGWHQLCSTWDGGVTASGIIIYVDGVQILTYDLNTNGGPNQVDASYPLTIGALGGITKQNFFHGYIDDVMMFNRILSATEISDLYARDGTITNGSSAPLQPVGGLSCTTAGTGPFVKAGEATGATDYGFWGDGTYVYTTGGSGVSALSTTLSGSITRIDTKAFGDTGYADIWGDGTYIYAVSSNNLRAMTFDGTTLSSAGSIATGGTNASVFGDGTYIYVAAGSAGLKAYSFDGTNFTLKGTYAGNMQDVWSDGSYIYASGGTTAFYVLTFDGSAFTLVDSDDAGTVTQSWGDGTYIYTNANGLIAYSFDGISLSQIDSVSTDLTGIRIWADGQNILVGGSTGIIRDYTFNGRYFRPVAATKLAGAINNLWSDGAYLYVGENTKNAQIFSGFECGTSAAAPTALSLAMDADRGKVTSSDGSCLIKQNGSLWCWGNDALGHLGNGSIITANQDTMSRVNSSESWRFVDAGDGRACGITASGRSYCWGDDLNQELGNGAGTTQQDSPSLVSGGKTFKKIKTSYSGAVCAIDHDGNIWCWGVDSNGQIGNGAATGTKNVPTATTVEGPFVDLGYGRATPCAVKYNGSLWCWGRNNVGQAGSDADTGSGNVNAPTEISEPGPWIRVAAGNYTACGIKADGTLWCWGSGQDGMLGSGKVEGDFIAPKRIADPGPWVDVDMSHGQNAAIALKADGTIWTWGLNSTYVLAQPTLNAQYLEPTRIDDPGPWTAISIGMGHGCAMKMDHSVWCWGDDTSGRLGNGPVLTANTPTPAPVLNNDKNDPFVWNDTGTLLTASGGGHYLVGTTAGISFDGSNGASWSNGLVFPGSGTAGLRRDTGNQDYLLETGFATGNAQLSWKAASATNTRSMGIDYTTQNFLLGNNDATVSLGMNAITSQINIGTNGYVGVKGTTAPAARLDINGGLRIGNDTGVCIPPRKGTIRYVGGSVPYQYCNGSTWVDF